MAKNIHEAVEGAFKFYETKNYTGHKDQPEIKEDAASIAEKLSGSGVANGNSDAIASISAFLACESRGCPLNLKTAFKYSVKRINSADMQKARDITGMRQKLKAEDWVDGVIRTLKSKGYVPDEKEDTLFETSVQEIPNINVAKSQTPRYKAISAVYSAARKLDINITKTDLRWIFNMSEHSLPHLGPRSDIKASTIENEEIAIKVASYLKQNKNILYRASDLAEILDIDKPLYAIIDRRAQRLGLVRYHEKRNGAGPEVLSRFGFSDTCGSSTCFSDECYGELVSCMGSGKGYNNCNLKNFKLFEPTR